MKRIKLKYIFYTFFVLLAVVLLTFILLFQRNIRTAASVRKLEDGLYSMEYKGDYNLDGFLEQGGASDDLAVAEFVIQDVFHGLLPIDLRVLLGAAPSLPGHRRAMLCLEGILTGEPVRR